MLTKTHRVLKQHYKPVHPPASRTLLEHLLFASCLENAPYEAAEKIYAYLSKHFFDWNEVRVSTVTELAEAMRSLPEPAAAASNLKRILQGVFEATYSFDLETLKKKNIGEGIKWLEKLPGSTPFSVAYVTAAALAGHAIPLDRGAWEVLAIVGIPSEAEVAAGKMSGLERAIPKNKGSEFSSLLHQLAADWVANPHSPTVRKTLLDINRDAKDRFPKRGAKKEVPPPAAPTPAPHGAAHAAADAAGKKKVGADVPKPAKGAEKAAAGGAATHAAAAHAAAAHAAATQKRPAEMAPKNRDGKDSAAKDKDKDQKARKHEAPKHEKVEKGAGKTDHKKPAAAGHKTSQPARPHKATQGRKSPTKQLSKRKPR